MMDQAGCHGYTGASQTELTELACRMMSELLGRQDCIERLRKDVVDLQGAILDVFSRTGPIRFSSWKFPDRDSCSLDMVALLDRYDYVDGEDDFNQLSHTVLLELLVDRLLLLLQSFNAYVEQIRCSHRRERTQQKACLSVGLVVMNYWSNLIQFANLKETYKDNKKQTFDSDRTEKASSVSPQMNTSRHCMSASSSTSSLRSLPQGHTLSSASDNTPHFPAADSHTVSCQTVESSLIPCDACHNVQSTLIKTGHAVVELLQSESLPSSLQPLLAAVEDTLELGHMTAADVAQWAGEQLRDMLRLAKHLGDLRGTVQPLRDRLAAAEADREGLRSQLERTQKEFKEETEKHQANVVQLEFSLSKAQRSIRESEQRLREEQQQRKRETASLEDTNSKLKDKVAQQHDALQALECESKALQEKVKSLHVEQEACNKLQQRIQQLERQVSETQLSLDKENAKYLSACRQQESMQGKQKSLLERVDALDEECEELQRQQAEMEETQRDLHQQLQQMADKKEELQFQCIQQQGLCLELREDKHTLKTRICELEGSVAELKTNLEALRERERLLVAFPELSPLAQAPPKSTGNVLLDMERQLQANNIRAKILEQENVTLYTSLVKLRGRAPSYAAGEAPQHMWSVSLPTTPVEKQHATQKCPARQNSSTTALQCDNRSREARRGESGPESAGSEDRMSSSSLQLHLQTLHLDTDGTAARKQTKTLPSHPRRSNQRKGMKPRT